MGLGVLPSDAGHDAARMARELSADQRPAAVSLPETAQDVIAAVAFARERGLRVVAQRSGHNPNPLGDLADAVLVKTERMAEVLVDRVARARQRECVR